MASSCKHQVVTAFSIAGYSLRSEASKYLLSVLEPLDDNERTKYIQKSLDFIESQSLSTNLIDKSTLQQAVQSFQSARQDENACLKVIDAFSIPAYSYHNDAKKFILKSNLTKSTPCLFGLPDSKLGMYVERYKMIRQRTLHHKLFMPTAVGSQIRTETSFNLLCVEQLLGAQSKKDENVIVLGMLAQLKEAQFFLEDPTGSIKLDLSQATFKDGLYTEYSIVLVEGNVCDNVLHATAVGFPPPEPASVTLSRYPYFDSSSGTATTSYRLSEKLKAAERDNEEALFLFLSDVWLDQLKIMKKLEALLSGYAHFPPACIVLIGNFVSLSNVVNYEKVFQDCFEKLGKLINDYPSLATKTTFIFVPGPDDPGLNHILPRPPIPESLLTKFRKHVPNAIFTTNPCRLQYCTQEMVVFREDILQKVCRSAIHVPHNSEIKLDLPSLFVKTIIANSHLLPLPINVAPRYWDYDHSFWLYPLPDVVVCADKCDPYTVNSMGCVFFNTGSLSSTNFCFKVYIPAKRQVEESQVTDAHLG